MKTTELRIGNILHRKGGIVVIEEITKKTITTYFGTDNLPNNLTNIDPIPLTKEWLLDFGFIKGDWNSILGKDHYVLYSNYDYPFIVSVRYMDVYTEMQPLFGDKGIGLKAITDNRGIKYVHQLQNLYFALTGEELNYKPL